MWRKGNLGAVSGNVNWYSHYGKHRFLKKLNLKLLYYPAIPPLGVFPKKTKTLI